MYNTLKNRPFVRQNSTALQRIANKKCWHFDAWLGETSQPGMLALHVKTSAGGREQLTAMTYLILNGRLKVTPRNTVARLLTLDDLSPDEYDTINALHWRTVFGMARRVPAGFRSRSVALHYIRAPSLDPIPPTVTNWSRYTKLPAIL